MRSQCIHMKLKKNLVMDTASCLLELQKQRTISMGDDMGHGEMTWDIVL